MDISGKYIKMCRKAEEIQGLSPIQFASGEAMRRGRINSVDNEWHGSYFFAPFLEGVEVLHYDNDECRDMIGGYGDDLTGIVWLPRQDQLQKMVAESFGGQKVSMLWHFAEYLRKDRPIEYSLDVTLEQLWLCYVMKEKYNKVWDGETWSEKQAKTEIF